MADWIIILIGIVFILLIGWTVFFIIRRRKKKKKVLEIPNDILEDFQEAERRYKKSHGEKNPHTILYEIAKERGERDEGNGGEDRTAYSPKPAVVRSNLYKPIQRREVVQDDVDSVDRQQYNNPERTRPSRKRSLFGRRRIRRASSPVLKQGVSRYG
jgi:hypothetical protein